MSTRKLRRKYRPSSMPVQGKGRIVRRALSHRREIDHGKRWYVVRAKAGRERRATRELRSLGFDIFWPINDTWRVWKHRCSDVSTGWLPGYLFVGFEESPRFDLIREADGVAGVLGVEGRPLAVRPEVLQDIADRVAGVQKTNPEPFKAGQTVSVARGPFAELRGRVEETGNGLARIVVEMFGKKHPVDLLLDDLKAA
jgi:transcription antitermination factor NusG